MSGASFLAPQLTPLLSLLAASNCTNIIMVNFIVNTLLRPANSNIGFIIAQRTELNLPLTAQAIGGFIMIPTDFGMIINKKKWHPVFAVLC